MIDLNKYIYVNDLLISLSGSHFDGVMIVIYLNKASDEIFLLSLKKKSKPKLFSYCEVLSWLRNDEIRKGEFDENEFWKKPEEYFSEKDLIKRNKKYEVIKPLLISLNKFLTSKHYNARMVAGCLDVAIKIGLSATRWQIYQWFYRYLQCGKNVNAFLRKPGTGISKNKVYQEKTGPKRSEGKACNGRMRDENDNKNILAILRKYVFCLHPLPLTQAFIEYENQYASDIVVDPFTGDIVGYKKRESVKHISEDQFKYFSRKYMSLNADKVRECQGTTDEYNKNEKGLSGDVHKLFGQGPGHDYQIDETPLDIELVDEFDPERKRRLGKPTCYSVIDMFSRAWVGVLLTFSKASAHTAREIVLIACRDKEEFCKDIGVTLNESWPFKGKCKRIIVDNAEFSSALTDAFSSDAGITVSFNIEGNSQQKGLVERRHKSLEDFLYGRIPGVGRKYVQDYVKRRLRSNALLNIRELYQIIIDYITRFNNYYPLETNPLTKEMRADGVKNIPLSKWLWGLENCPGYLAKITDEQDFFMRLLETGYVTVKRDGLFLQGTYIKTLKNRKSSKGLLYTCSWTYSNKIHESKIGELYKCKFMRYSMSKIWIVTPDGLQEAVLHPIDACYEWWSSELVQDDKNNIAIEGKELKDIYNQKQSETKAAIKIVTNKAKQQKIGISVNAANTQELSVNRNIAIEKEIDEAARQLLLTCSADDNEKSNNIDQSEPILSGPHESPVNTIASIFSQKSKSNRTRRG